MNESKAVLRGRRRAAGGSRVAFAGTVVVHGVAAVFLFASPSAQAVPTVPVYNVRLVAAPRPEPELRPAPEVVQRPAEQPQPTPSQPRRETVAEAPPPPEKDTEKEPAPRTTPEEEPLPDEDPSTGDDPATLNVSGVNFPFPEYINNIVTQIYRRWQRPARNESRRAEILFLVRRDGSIANLRFTIRSGSFAFDLEAQGAIEAAGTAGAFGALPDGFEGDILPVSFFFDPSTLRR